MKLERKIFDDKKLLGELQRKVMYAHSDVLAKVLDQLLKRPATVDDVCRIKLTEMPFKKLTFGVLFDGVMVGIIEGRFDVNFETGAQKYICDFTPAADYKG